MEQTDSLSRRLVRQLVQSVTTIFLSLLAIYTMVFVLLKVIPTSLEQDALTSSYFETVILVISKAKISLIIGFVAYVSALFLAAIWLILALEYKKLRNVIYAVADVVNSVPSLVVFSIGVFLFCVWIPVADLLVDADVTSYFLPILLLSLKPSFFIVRQVESSLLDSASMDCVRTALAKGLSRRQVLYHHVFRLSLPSFLSFQAPLFANLLTGSFLLEKLFSIQGLGLFFIDSLLRRDVDAVLVCTMVFALALVLIQSLIELVLPLSDPRVRIGEKI